MTDFITNPYTFTEAEKNIILKNFNVHSDWENEVFKTVKKNIIAHLRIEQDNKCCYCKRELGIDIKDVDIEHIIPKSKYEKFTFFPKNLALSCPGCNTKKSKKDVLVKPIVNYPRSSTPFRIIHAHYDKYSQHIDIAGDCIYVALTKKGSETITLCELFRLRKVEDHVKKNTTKLSMVHLTKLICSKSNEEAVAVLEEIKADII